MEGNAWDRAFSELGGVAEKVGNAVEEHLAAQDTSKLSKDYADTFDKLTRDWNSTITSADPNATDTADKWRQQVLEPALEQFGADVSSKHGQQAAERVRSEMRSHFYQKSIGDESAANGNAITSNLEHATNVLSQTVYKDPTSFQTALDIYRALVKEQVAAHPNIGAEDASKIMGVFSNKVEKEIAVSAFRGMAEVNAPAAIEALASGKFNKYFSGEEAAQLNNYAKNQEKLNTTLEQKANKERADAEAAQIQASTVGPNGEITLPKDYYANVANWMARNAAKPGAAEGIASQGRAMIDFGRAVQNDMEKGTPVVTDPHTYEDFQNRAFLPDSDPRKLTATEVFQARANRMLSDKDFSFWHQAVTSLSKDEAKSAAQKDFDSFLKSYKGYITKSSMLKVDGYGDQKYYEWTSRAQQMHDEMAARKVPEKDIRDAIVKVLPQYQVGRDQAITGIKEQATTGLKPLPAGPNVPKRLPNESVTDYLKRTGQ